jgi:uncharacterized membrane protein
MIYRDFLFLKKIAYLSKKIKYNTMQTFLNWVLYLHISAGFTALVTGLIPMFSKKGGKTHVTWGKVYFWAMFVVAVTALLRFKLRLDLIFLACIAIFSFYNTFTGIRIIRMKKQLKPAWIDWFGAISGEICGIIMLYFSFYAYQEGNVFFIILFLVFGVVMLLFATEDLRVFTGKKVIDNDVPTPARYWFQNHISRMGGSYIATVTAFLVVNNPPFIPGLVAWIAPGVIGGIIIGQVRKKYREQV